MKKTELDDDTPSLTDLLLTGAMAQELGLGEKELGLALAVANMKLKSGKAEEALSMYAILVLCKPMDVEYQCGLANCALLMNEYEMTLQAASAIVRLAPSDCRGYYFSGVACLGLGHLDEAREDIADALTFAQSGTHPDIHDASRKFDVYLNTTLA